jgi:two-component system, OmpR family, osmolarity sensor histidine kinase EnvZ
MSFVMSHKGKWYEPFMRVWLRVALLWRRFARRLADYLPKGLYARALLIIILPMVLLQSAIAYFFMERHWQLVTYRLSAAVVQDVAAAIDIYDNGANPEGFRLAQKAMLKRTGLDIEIMPNETLPEALPRPFFSLLDRALSREVARQIGRPYWVDTVGRSSYVEIRIALDHAVVRAVTHRNSVYASNSHIFIMWMIGTSLVLIGVAVAFMRNQIRPILRLAEAAEDFGKGRDFDFRPHGAREVRQAGQAFYEMKRRIGRTIEQRTAMLNGVSHDLRTILTRFKLSLALMDESAELEAIQRDVDEMQRMLEAYLAFARGDMSEAAEPVDIGALLNELKADAERHGHETHITTHGDMMVQVRPDAFKRCLANLVGNAQRFGNHIALTAEREGPYLFVHVDDDGPGIPEAKREEVFRPFVRLDEARNMDESGTGLGLAIARDIARAHGGDIVLSESPLKGLRATVRVPV